MARRCEDGIRHPAPLPDRDHVAVGGQAAARIRRRHHASSGSRGSCRRCCGRWRSPRPSRATRTTRTSRSLVGKVDIRKLEHFAQNDPDAYSYSGGLCLANQGLLEFVEMFKAPIKMLHPLLTATQEGNFKGTEGFSAIPFNGVIVAHSNESEWQSFRNNKNNEAFLDRIYIVKVPYCLRVSDEVKIYEKLLRQLVACSRAVRAGDARHDGAVLGAVAAEGAGELQHVLEDAGVRRRDAEGHRSEGEDAAGVSRLRRCRRRHERPVDAVRVQGAVSVFNHDQTEIAANPVHLMYVLEQRIAREDLPDEVAPALPRASSRATSRPATPSSSARKSRRRTSSRTPSTARTSSTAT